MKKEKIDVTDFITFFIFIFILGSLGFYVGGTQIRYGGREMQDFNDYLEYIPVIIVISFLLTLLNFKKWRK